MDESSRLWLVLTVLHVQLEATFLKDEGALFSLNASSPYKKSLNIDGFLENGLHDGMHEPAEQI